MEGLTTEAVIGLFITIISMFVGWIVMAKKDAAKRRKERETEREDVQKLAEQTAYERGLHDAVHTDLQNDVTSAHAKLREHDLQLAELHKNDAAHGEVHNALLTQFSQMHKTVDTIHRVIMGRSNRTDDIN